MRDRHRVAMAVVTVAALCTAAALSVAENAPVPPVPGPANSGAAVSKPVPPAVTILNSHEVEGILGRQVRSAANEDMGHVVDVLVDRAGQARAAIIDFGGFLGVGSRKIAVDWNVLRFAAAADESGKITLELTRDQVKHAPEYQDGKPVVVLGALGKLEPLPYP